jgi:outer membrane protein assembly factor BamD
MSRSGSQFAPLTMLIVAASLMTAACGGSRTLIPPGTLEPDRFLFERGTEALNERRWLTAREFFRQVTDTYTQSSFRPDAKLGIGDTFLGEGSAEALVSAVNEFREFLAFYPTHPRADYAQYRLAMTYFRQMRAPQRDQTETRNALREFEVFIARYPNSTLLPEVKARQRDAQDRLSSAEFEVGLHYYRIRWYPGAIDRFTTLLKNDPGYSRRDNVYFYLGETLVRAGRQAEALPYFEKLLAEFASSEHVEDARRRVTDLKAQASKAS